jgi:hypothetical protein
VILAFLVVSFCFDVLLLPPGSVCLSYVGVV